MIRWTFYDKTNNADSVTVVFKYISYPLGISEKASLRAELSNVYPNPASSHAGISYSFDGSAQGTLIVRDMIGKTVYSEELADSNGKISINTNGFGDGIYFISLLVDGKITQTRKLIVNH